MNESGEVTGEYVSSIIFENANYALRYSGPAPSEVKRVVISFPDLIHPAGFDALGWGEDFFSNRGQPVICVLFKKANWYQSEGFFEAMRAARSFLGEKVKISAYGASMGGYGAILAGKALQADYVLALCPQYTIQQDIAPFERRYRDQARAIGTFSYDIDKEMDDQIDYVVIYDPTHNIDRRHEALFESTQKWTRIPLPGSSHGVLSNILEMVSKDVFIGLILKQISPREFRSELRKGRISSPRYIRRMGNLTLAKHHEFSKIFIDIAREQLYFRLMKKWQEALRDHKEHRPEIILHPGLPKTGTSAIQMYFKSTNRKYARRGVSYPLEGSDPQVFSHSWLSSCLRDGDLSVLSQHLKRLPHTTQKLIISDESLYVETPLLTPETRAELREILAPYLVRIVFGQRPLAKWKKSFYLQALKNKQSKNQQGASRLWGTTLSYRKFYEDDYTRQLTDFKTRIADISDLFGAQNVEIITMKAGQDIVPDFCEAAGLRYFDETPAGFGNLSMTDVDGEIQRQANSFTIGQAGFIKRVMGLKTDANIRSMRANRLKKMAAMGSDLPWQEFTFKTNAPLKYTKSAFVERAAELEGFAERITQAAAAL